MKTTILVTCAALLCALAGAGWMRREAEPANPAGATSGYDYGKVLNEFLDLVELRDVGRPTPCVVDNKTVTAKLGISVTPWATSRKRPLHDAERSVFVRLAFAVRTLEAPATDADRFECDLDEKAIAEFLRFVDDFAGTPALPVDPAIRNAELRQNYDLGWQVMLTLHRDATGAFFLTSRNFEKCKSSRLGIDIAAMRKALADACATGFERVKATTPSMKL